MKNQKTLISMFNSVVNAMFNRLCYILIHLN
nr:hypothetical protein [Gloeotrichia echinulata DEX184]